MSQGRSVIGKPAAVRICVLKTIRGGHVRDSKPLLESAVEAARARIRPILRTPFAFILGVLPRPAVQAPT